METDEVHESGAGDNDKPVEGEKGRDDDDEEDDVMTELVSVASKVNENEKDTGEGSECIIRSDRSLQRRE
jgi:hypothetical protein